MIRVMIVAHYAAVRAGLHALLGEAGDIEVIADFSESEELGQADFDAHPDVVLFDDNGVEASQLLQMVAWLDVALVVLSDDGAQWTRRIDLIPRGLALLRKEADGREIINAVRAASTGLIALDRSLSAFIRSNPDQEEIEPPAILPSDEPLSAREREVLQLMTLGLPNKQIAARLSISLSTVKFHVASILAKMGAASRTEAVTLGIRRGDVSL